MTITVQAKNSEFVHDFECRADGSVWRCTHGVGKWVKVSHRDEVWTHEAMLRWLVAQGYREVTPA